MPFDFSVVLKHFTTFSVLLFLYLLIHSKIKRQTLKESSKETIDFFKSILGVDNEDV